MAMLVTINDTSKNTLITYRCHFDFISYRQKQWISGIECKSNSQIQIRCITKIQVLKIPTQNTYFSCQIGNVFCKYRTDEITVNTPRPGLLGSITRLSQSSAREATLKNMGKSHLICLLIASKWFAQNHQTNCLMIKNKANLRDLIAATSLVILLKLNSNRWFFSPCDLDIWWKTPKNNRAPLLCYFKLFASFVTIGEFNLWHCHRIYSLWH